MYRIISIILATIGIASSTFLEAESNYLKPKLERNNIVNKGVWVRNKDQDTFDKTNIGNFIFKPNSLDVEDLSENGFYSFGANDVQNTPYVSNYIERSKRSPNLQKKQRLRRNLNECKDSTDCLLESFVDDKSLVKSKLISKLKPTSFFNDYPYEVAILLGNVNKQANDIYNYTKPITTDVRTIPRFIVANESKDKSKIEMDILVDNEISVNNTSQEHIKNNSTPKRSMKNDFESKVIKKIEIIEDINNTEVKRTLDRNIFDKDDRMWHQNAPVQNINSYKVVPKIDPDRYKPISERGLVKVLGMLTKTFKRIMKQHSDIKKVQNKMYAIKVDVEKNVANMLGKFGEFESKYAFLGEINNRIKSIEEKLNIKEDYLKNKETEMSKNLIEFENHQKKFLAQQNLFYNIQKLMLAQNEKINLKQSIIAKTQSAISHRQNNFARILKKAKQLYTEAKIPTSKFPLKSDKTVDAKTVTHTTTSKPSITDPIKINLLAVPTSTKLVNNDKLILKEKDEHAVDDLVYKYYFNNTFIDNLIRNQILSGTIMSDENHDLTRNVKNKRNEFTKEANTTKLVPVKKTNAINVDTEKPRQKRWIRHHSKRLRRKNRGKQAATVHDVDVDKTNKHINENEIIKISSKIEPTTTLPTVKNKGSTQAGAGLNPFMGMATNFCNQIGQNTNIQILNWCIEKTLRKLQNIESNLPIPVTKQAISEKVEATKHSETTTSFNNQLVSSSSTVPTTVQYQNTPSEATTNNAGIENALKTISPIFFPDNEELESNLKQFELKADTEGNVYYDGSIHTSDIVLGPESDGFSDIMPGLDSNSRVELDPLAIDLQSRRRAFVRRINENVMKKMLG